MARRIFSSCRRVGIPWNNDEGCDADRRHQPGDPIDYLAVTFIVSLVGFPCSPADAATSG
jgi:hypothetical protein